MESSLSAITSQDKIRFLEQNNPDTQNAVAKLAREDLFMGDYPTLVDVKNKYSEGTAQAFIAAQLVNFCEYAGVKEKMNGSQLDQTVNVILLNYPYLKTTELRLFFWKFKSGAYGTFYGRVDPMMINVALKAFIRDRADAIDSIECERRRTEREGYAKKAISYSEWREQMQKSSESARFKPKSKLVEEMYAKREKMRQRGCK